MYHDLQKQLVQARLRRESPVYASAEELRIKHQLDKLAKGIWPNQVYRQSDTGPVDLFEM